LFNGERINISEESGINTRQSWISQAEQGAFFVLNYNRQYWYQSNIFNTENSDLSIKFRFIFEF